MSRGAILPLCAALLVLAVVAGLCVGRYPLPAAEVLQALAHRIGLAPSTADATAEVILFAERGPRVIAAILIGAGLSLSGAAYQWDRHGPEFALQMLWTAKLLHPSRFKDVDMAREAAGFYRRLFGYSMTPTEVSSILSAQPPPR